MCMLHKRLCALHARACVPAAFMRGSVAAAPHPFFPCPAKQRWLCTRPEPTSWPSTGALWTSPASEKTWPRCTG